MNLILHLLDSKLNLLPCLEITTTNTLLLLISVKAPVVPSNSIGMNTFRFTFILYSRTHNSLSFAVPLPAPIAVVFHTFVLSNRTLNRLTFAKSLYELYKFVDRMSNAFAAAPLHCLSHMTNVLTVSCVTFPADKSPGETSMNSKSSLIMIFVIVHFLPILSDSPVP